MLPPIPADSELQDYYYACMRGVRGKEVWRSKEELINITFVIWSRTDWTDLSREWFPVCQVKNK